MRPLLFSLLLVTGCIGSTGAHETLLDPIAATVQGVVDFAAAQDIRPVIQPTNGCLPIDYYVGGATYLIRKTDTGCEWIAYNEGGGEIAHGTVPRAGS